MAQQGESGPESPTSASTSTIVKPPAPPLRVLVAGGGSWGTTVAHLCAHNAETTLWARDAVTVDAVNNEHRNPRYLPDYPLHPDLMATSDLEEVLERTDLLVMGVPTSAYRTTCEAIAPHLRPWVPVVSLAKGFEPGTMLRMSQIIEQVLPDRPVGVLTGPNLAKEIMAGHPTAAVIALADLNIARKLQQVFTTPTFRVFLHHDVIGCELGGALKNIYAIAAGMVEGRGQGDNARAAIITRGLAELIELGSRLGGEPLTLAGLAGMGDLIATCVSPQSRNSQVGRKLGTGMTVDDILAEMNQVAEGVKAAEVVNEMAQRHGVFMPIAEQVYAVCHRGQDADFAQDALLRGRLGHEQAVPGQSWPA
ncbi:MAG: NAD(P)H-dependent glycerol-3-phosphate dehydrogenase [Acidimicrobiia bacterium]|nr:NAD(P)H-dependent glycerol-3-phosphate dehydrogenase [Acidimicrobiia bacterium]